MVSSRNDWFPTPIWCFEVENHQELNPLLLQAIDAESERDREGEKWSNVLGWHSRSDLHLNEKFQEFNRIVEKNVAEVADFLKWDLRYFSTNITTCWAMVNGKLASNSAHNHPNSILSGIYYLKVPKNSGGLFFNDPRPASQILVPPIAEFNLWTSPKIVYKANVGTMMLFPSWLLHGVEMNMSRELRVSLNFNIGMAPVK